jgi:hypothetical protein
VHSGFLHKVFATFYAYYVSNKIFLAFSEIVITKETALHYKTLPKKMARHVTVVFVE